MAFLWVRVGRMPRRCAATFTHYKKIISLRFVRISEWVSSDKFPSGWRRIASARYHCFIIISAKAHLAARHAKQASQTSLRCFALLCISGKLPLSHAAACDGLIYTINNNRENSNMQGYWLPLFED